LDRSVALVLQDLHIWGADTLTDFQARVGETVTAELVLGRLVKVLDGSNFRYVTLGPKGREQLGLRPNHTVKAAAAARHIMRREAKAQLEALGLTFVGAEDRVMMRFSDAQGTSYFLAASLSAKKTGYTARAVRSLLARYQGLLLTTKGILVIATPYPGRLSRTLEKHRAYVKTLKVDGSICNVGCRFP